MGVKVRCRREDTWWVVIDHKGKRRSISCGRGRDGKRAADLAVVQIAAQLAVGGTLKMPAEPAPTFAAAAEEYLKLYPGLRDVQPGTLRLRTHYVEKHLVPYFAGRRIDSITAGDVEYLIYAKRAPGSALRGKQLSDQTIRGGLLIGLRGILDLAVRRSWLPVNPMRLGPLWRPTPHIVRPDPFELRELRTLLEAAQAIEPRFALRLRVWAQSGPRSGELRGLQRGDLDVTAGTVTVGRSRTLGRTGPPKTERSRRTVSIVHPILQGGQLWHPDEATAESRSVLRELERVQPLDVHALSLAGGSGASHGGGRAAAAVGTGDSPGQAAVSVARAASPHVRQPTAQPRGTAAVRGRPDRTLAGRDLAVLREAGGPGARSGRNRPQPPRNQGDRAPELTTRWIRR
jgi:integrase